jgi:hypothetical protein
MPVVPNHGGPTVIDYTTFLYYNQFSDYKRIQLSIGLTKNCSIVLLINCSIVHLFQQKICNIMYEYCSNIYNLAFF